MRTLRVGTTGADVSALQKKLVELGFDCGAESGTFGPGTQAAVTAFQRSKGLLPDGVVGPITATALGLTAPPEPASAIPAVTVEIVSKMFPATPAANIRANLPFVLNALVAPQLAEKAMVLMALATIRAETESFLPISEGVSSFNTSPGGHPFDLYDNRADLGNHGAPDGERFRGRGFIQLTGRANYQQHGQAIGLGDQLLTNPDLANDPGVAAQLLASFLKSREQRIRQALLNSDLAGARKLVNGGSHGLDRFTDAFQKGSALIPEALQVQATSSNA
jgi:putative chitinase